MSVAGSLPEEFGTCCAKPSRTYNRDVDAASASIEARFMKVRRAIMDETSAGRDLTSDRVARRFALPWPHWASNKEAAVAKAFSLPSQGLWNVRHVASCDLWQPEGWYQPCPVQERHG